MNISPWIQITSAVIIFALFSVSFSCPGSHTLFSDTVFHSFEQPSMNFHLLYRWISDRKQPKASDDKVLSQSKEFEFLFLPSHTEQKMWISFIGNWSSRVSGWHESVRKNSRKLWNAFSESGCKRQPRQLINNFRAPLYAVFNGEKISLPTFGQATLHYHVETLFGCF